MSRSCCKTFNSTMAGLVLSVLTFTLLFNSSMAWGVSDYVYQIKINNSAGKWSQSGFRLRGTKGIITALHGVVSATSIKAHSVSGTTLKEKLKVLRVDIKNDLALLWSRELAALPANGLESASVEERFNKAPSKVWVHGFPEGLTYYTPLKVDVNPIPFTSLRESILPKLAITLDKRSSPHPDSMVLRLQIGIRPGHSGAPVCNEFEQVLAVANGGLKGGNAGLNWAIPLPPGKVNDWAEADNNDALRALTDASIADLFSTVDDVAALATKIEVLRAEITKARMNHEELLKILRVELDPKKRLLDGDRARLSELHQTLGDLKSGRISVSDNAKRLGQCVSEDENDPIALALKAMTEERFIAAKKYLYIARDKNDAESLQINELLATNALYEGDYAESYSAFRDKESDLRKLIRRQKNLDQSLLLRQELASTVFILGFVADLLGFKDESLQYFDEAVSINTELLELAPKSLDLIRELGVAENSRGVLLDDADQHGKAKAAYKRAEQFFLSARKESSNDPVLKEFYANVLVNMAKVESEEENASKALKLGKKARRLREELVAADPSDLRLKAQLAETLGNLGAFQLRTSEAKRAIESFTAARMIQEQILAVDETQHKVHLALSGTYGNIGFYYSQFGSVATAKNNFQSAVSSLKLLKDRVPQSFRVQAFLARSLYSLATLEYHIGNWDVAADHLSESIDEIDSTIRALKPKQAALYQLEDIKVESLELLAAISLETGKPDDAIKSFKRIEKIRLEHVARSQESLLPRYSLASVRSGSVLVRK